MSPELLRTIVYVFAVVIGLLVARVQIDTRERRELRAKLRQANRFRENVAAGTLTLTQQGNIELTIKPELTPGRVVTVEFTPTQADQLVEWIVKLRKASAKTWTLN